MFKTATDFFRLFKSILLFSEVGTFLCLAFYLSKIVQKHGGLKACEKAKVKNEMGECWNENIDHNRKYLK